MASKAFQMPKRKRFKDATASPIKRYKLVFGEGVVYDNSSVEEYLKALDINLKKMTEVMTKAQKFHSFFRRNSPRLNFKS